MKCLLAHCVLCYLSRNEVVGGGWSGRLERGLETVLSRTAGAALRLFQCRLGLFQELHLQLEF